mgnify:CR=1 FL=1
MSLIGLFRILFLDIKINGWIINRIMSVIKQSLIDHFSILRTTGINQMTNDQAEWLLHILFEFDLFEQTKEIHDLFEQFRNPRDDRIIIYTDEMVDQILDILACAKT